MIRKNVNIWIWIHDGKLLKAILSETQGTLSMYDEYDRLIFTRRGLTVEDFKSFKYLLSMIGARRIDDKKEPFIYL